MTGDIHEFWLRTMEKHVRMVKYPHDAYKCGIYALDQVGHALQLDFDRGRLLKTRSKKEGFSLAELEVISADYNLGLVGVARTAGSATIPYPSVVHWRQEHYAAIVERLEDNLFKIADPSAAGVLYLTAEEINAEATGYFLVPKTLAQREFTPVPLQEALQVIGRATACPPEDWEDGCGGSGGGGSGGGSGGGNGGGSGGSGGGVGGGGGGLGRRLVTPSGFGGGGGDPSPKPPGCLGCGGTSGGGGGAGGGAPGDPCCETNEAGMITWKVSEPYLNVLLTDTPLFYRPSKGPAVNLTLTYKMRGSYQPYYGFGSKFSHPWQSNVTPDGSGYSCRIALPGPTELDFTFASPTATTASRTYRSPALLTRTFSGGFINAFYLQFPDGTKYSYETDDGFGVFYLNKITAPDGYSLVIARDTAVHGEKITTITDGDGGIITFYYEDPTYDNLVTKVTAPGSRQATFQYQVTQYSRNLTSITDAAGIQSTLTFDSTYGIDPTSISTPYGTTYFERPGIAYSSWDRALIVTLPTGAREAYLLIDAYYGGDIPAFATSQLPTSTPFAITGYDYGTIETTSRDERNTFYWSAKQYAALSNTNITTMTWAEFKQARIRHWLWKLDPSSLNHVDTLNHEQLPSPDGGLTEGAITWYDYDGKSYTAPYMRGTRMEPAVIARVQPDGSTTWTWFQRNGWGRATKEIERWVENGSARTRTNTYAWSSDGLDLLEHRFGSSEGEHLEVGYGYDVSVPRFPVRMTNALNEITHFTYYPDKQLKTAQYPSGLLTNNILTSGYVTATIDYFGSTPFRTNSFTWEYGRIKTHTSPRGLTTTNTYDALDRLTRIDFTNGANMAFAYTNGSGVKLLHRTYMKNEIGAVTRWEYNSLAQVAREFDPLDRITAYGYCSCGTLDRVTNALGSGLDLVTAFVYDMQGRLTETYGPGGINLTNVYDSWGRVTRVKDALGTKTNIFDNLGRLVRVDKAFGQEQRVLYNNEGLIRTNIDSGAVSTIMNYDNLHRLTTRTVGPGTETFAYSPNVWGPTSYTDQLSKVTTTAITSLVGRPKKSSLASQQMSSRTILLETSRLSATANPKSRSGVMTSMAAFRARPMLRIPRYSATPTI
jgi:YD repeat-containing protein